MVGFAIAACAALTLGIAALLQAIGARRVSASPRVDPRLLYRLLHSRAYVVGLALNLVAFVLAIVALHSLPLFIVQAIVASNLAVIAVLATCVLRTRLRPWEWLAIGGVVGGVVLLVLSGDPSHAAGMVRVGQWALLAAAVAMAAVSLLAGRRLRGAALLGLLAGLTYGVVAVAARVLGADISVSPMQLLSSPLTYALAVGGILGTLLYATALQRGSVTTASAMTIVGQTLGPAIVGWVLLGDAWRPGFASLSVTGFALTLVGAVVLARHAHIEVPRHLPRVSIPRQKNRPAPSRVEVTAAAPD